MFSELSLCFCLIAEKDLNKFMKKSPQPQNQDKLYQIEFQQMLADLFLNNTSYRGAPIFPSSAFRSVTFPAATRDFPKSELQHSCCTSSSLLLVSPSRG